MSATRPIDRPSGHLVEIPRARCEELLRQRSVGRVGFTSAAGPHILPVSYRIDNDTVVFRTSPHGALSVLARRTPVAFEIDDIDEAGGTAWNVLVQGFSEAVTRDSSLAQLWRDGPVPWASGVRNMFIAITIESVTGRMVRGPFVD